MSTICSIIATIKTSISHFSLLKQEDTAMHNKSLDIFGVLVFSGLVAILLSTCMSIYTILGYVQDDGRVINVAGRQRMISQKVAGEALLLAQGHGSIDNLVSLQVLFERSLNGLAKGDPSMGLPSTEDAMILSSISRVEWLWNDYIEVLNKITQGKTPTTAEIEQLDRARTLMLDETNKIVSQFEERSRQHIFNLKLLVLASILLGACIFSFLISAEKDFLLHLPRRFFYFCFPHLKPDEQDQQTAPVLEEPQPSAKIKEPQDALESTETIAEPIVNVLALNSQLNRLVLSPEVMQGFQSAIDKGSNATATDMYKLKELHQEALALAERANELNLDLKTFGTQFTITIEKIGQR